MCSLCVDQGCIEFFLELMNQNYGKGYVMLVMLKSCALFVGQGGKTSLFTGKAHQTQASTNTDQSQLLVVGLKFFHTCALYVQTRVY